MKKVSRENLDALFAAIAEAKKLYLPVADGTDEKRGAKYSVWTPEAKYAAEAVNTVRSAKDFFFPQVENMVNFKVNGKKIEVDDIRTECEDFVIFGVRACDAASFKILDSVYLSEQSKAKTKAILEKLPLKNLSTDSFGGDKLMELFSSDKWASLSEACLGCGTCTFVCPTCQCYDIRDYDTGHGVQRFRCWDSCMYADFTKTAGGQPRPTQLERFRQRFMHKLVYYPANNDGVFGCVGCGRCMKSCPISMNIVKVMKTLGEGNA